MRNGQEKRATARTLQLLIHALSWNHPAGASLQAGNCAAERRHAIAFASCRDTDNVSVPCLAGLAMASWDPADGAHDKTCGAYPF